jgi:hypothetical protein
MRLAIAELLLKRTVNALANYIHYVFTKPSAFNLQVEKLLSESIYLLWNETVKSTSRQAILAERNCEV